MRKFDVSEFERACYYSFYCRGLYEVENMIQTIIYNGNRYLVQVKQGRISSIKNLRTGKFEK